jgi:hypothetical protein
MVVFPSCNEKSFNSYKNRRPNCVGGVNQSGMHIAADTAHAT